MSIVHKQQPFGAIVAAYHTAFAAALTAFLLKKKSKADTKDALKSAIMTFMLAAFLSGHRTASGHENLSDEDRAWIDVRLLTEVGYSAALVEALAGLDTTGLSDAEIRALAEARATGYSAALYGVYNEGLLRGNRRIYLTLDGFDGQESCRTCQRLKGRRKLARWWIDNGLIPGQAGNPNYECRGYQCLHYLRLDDGTIYTVQRSKEVSMPPNSMQIIRRDFEVKILESRPNGGRILINTGAVDRQSDRVLPLGARLENYQKNPIVQWGHNYKDPFATIGRTNTLIKSSEGIIADFDLRPAANEADPQNIVLLLWNGQWVRTASIGFLPFVGKANEVGGNDYSDWELLEWSIVPIPANQEALRLAMKSLGDEHGEHGQPIVDFRSVPGTLVWSNVLRGGEIFRGGEMTIEEPASSVPPEAADDSEPIMRAWIRKVTVETDVTAQHYANFMLRRVDVPADATILIQDDVLGECTEQPHPDRGQIVTLKTVLFVPPLQLANGRQVYTVERRECPDEELMTHDRWKISEQSDILDYLPAADVAKAIGLPFDQALPVDILTDKVFSRALELTQRLHRRHAPGLTVDDVAAAIDALTQKSGRVLSKKNENKIKAARDNLNEVLAEVEAQPEQDQFLQEDDLRAAARQAGVLSVACPFGCGALVEAVSWGAYACAACGGTFEVIPASGVFNIPFSDAVSDPDVAEVSALEPGTLLKGAIPPHTTPKADPDMAWDAGAVLRAAPNEARVLRRIHAWVNSAGDPDAKSSYKLPHHLLDGRVVLRGVNNAKARLPQSSIPSGDHPGCESHLNRHQRQFKQAEALRDYARALLDAAAELDGDDHLSDEDERALVSELRNLLSVTKEALS